MTGDDETGDELELNSPARYRKRSPRMVLEAHGHCEIPAGCGGVVLRWARKRSVRVQVSTWCPGRADAFMDGEAMDFGSADLGPGEHVLALRLRELPRAGVAMVALRLHRGVERYSGPPPPQVEALSRGDGRWRATADPPPAGWTEPGFDDSGWAPLEEVPPDALDRLVRDLQGHPGVASSGWARDYLATQGARPLRLPPGETVWVRRRLEVPDLGAAT